MRKPLTRFSSVFLMLMMLVGFQLLAKAASVPQLTMNFTNYGTVAATGGTVTGKAQDDSGIRIIDVYVDNHYVKSVRPEVMRLQSPPLCRTAFPTCGTADTALLSTPAVSARAATRSLSPRSATTAAAPAAI